MSIPRQEIRQIVEQKVQQSKKEIRQIVEQKVQQYRETSFTRQDAQRLLAWSRRRTVPKLNIKFEQYINNIKQQTKQDIQQWSENTLSPKIEQQIHSWVENTAIPNAKQDIYNWAKNTLSPKIEQQIQNWVENTALPDFQTQIESWVQNTVIPNAKQDILGRVQNTIGNPGDPKVWTSEALALDNTGQFRTPPTGLYKQIWQSADGIRDNVEAQLEQFIGNPGDPKIWTAAALQLDSVSEFTTPPTGMYRRIWQSADKIRDRVLEQINDIVGFPGNPRVWDVESRWDRLDNGQSEYIDPPTGMWSRIEQGLNVIGYPGDPRVWTNPDEYDTGQEPTGLWARIDEGVNTVEERIDLLRGAFSTAFDDINSMWSEGQTKLKTLQQDIQDEIKYINGGTLSTGETVSVQDSEGETHPSLIALLQDEITEVKNTVGTVRNGDLGDAECGVEDITGSGKGFIKNFYDQAFRLKQTLDCLGNLIGTWNLSLSIDAIGFDWGTNIPYPRAGAIRNSLDHALEMVNEWRAVIDNMKGTWDQMLDIPVVIQRISTHIYSAVNYTKKMAVLLGNLIQAMMGQLSSIFTDLSFDTLEEIEETMSMLSFEQKLNVSTRPPGTYTMITKKGVAVTFKVLEDGTVQQLGDAEITQTTESWSTQTKTSGTVTYVSYNKAGRATVVSNGDGSTGEDADYYYFPVINIYVDGDLETTLSATSQESTKVSFETSLKVEGQVQQIYKGGYETDGTIEDGEYRVGPTEDGTYRTLGTIRELLGVSLGTGGTLPSGEARVKYWTT